MEWSGFLESVIGSGPLALALGLAVRTLWARMRELETKLETLNAERLDDLRSLLKPDDSGPN